MPTPEIAIHSLSRTIGPIQYSIFGVVSALVMKNFRYEFTVFADNPVPKAIVLSIVDIAKYVTICLGVTLIPKIHCQYSTFLGHHVIQCF